MSHTAQWTFHSHLCCCCCCLPWSYSSTPLPQSSSCCCCCCQVVPAVQALEKRLGFSSAILIIFISVMGCESILQRFRACLIPQTKSRTESRCQTRSFFLGCSLLLTHGVREGVRHVASTITKRERQKHQSKANSRTKKKQGSKQPANPQRNRTEPNETSVYCRWPYRSSILPKNQ